MLYEGQNERDEGVGLRIYLWALGSLNWAVFADESKNMLSGYSSVTIAVEAEWQLYG